MGDVTPAEAYDLITQGGAAEFRRVVEACRSIGPYCLIGGLAVNCYVEPVYTLDADIVVVAENLERLAALLERQGFGIDRHPHSVNASLPGSALRVQFTTDARYQPFPARAAEQEVLGVPVRVACLEDVARGKLWAWADLARRLSKRKKDELDLIRLGEAYPQVLPLYPAELRRQLES